MTESPRCSFILMQGSNAGEPCGWIANTMTGDGPRCFAHARDSLGIEHVAVGALERITALLGKWGIRHIDPDDERAWQEAWANVGNDANTIAQLALMRLERGHRMNTGELPGERSEPPKPDDVLSRVRVVWEAHRGEPLTSGNYYRLVLDLQAVLDPEDS